VSRASPKKSNPKGNKTPISKKTQRDPLAQPPLEPALPLTAPSSGMGYSTLAMLDLMAEVYAKVWDYYLKDLYNPLVDILKDIFAHNRLSRNLVDPKMRSVFEFFSTIAPATAYNLRRHPTTAGDVSVANSRSPSLSSTPRKDCDPNLRPSSCQAVAPKKPTLHHHPAPPLADYPPANSHFFLFGRMLGKASPELPLTSSQASSPLSSRRCDQVLCTS
jgi:hypothetical protein